MSERIALANGGWFDKSAAECYDEASRWDGRNMISQATGRQWEHEELFRTRLGKWVLHQWSQGEGSPESWREYHDEDALRWLVANGHHAEAEQYGGNVVSGWEV